MAPNITTEMIKNLSGRERIFVDSFVEMFEHDNALVEKVCNFIASKTNDSGLIKDLKTLSPEGRCQACSEYIIIGLISGNIKVKELSKIVQEYTIHEPLIKDEHI